MKEIDPKTLAACNGKDGSPTYIVHKGRVIDVSGSKLWQGGMHMQRHSAGTDLTAKIAAAPHGLDVLDRYPQVGVLRVEQAVERPMPSFLSALLSRYPFLRRHPHPGIVHFPIAFMTGASAFYLLFLLSCVASFEVTALHCLGAGILVVPVAVVTGVFTWWLNYLARPMRKITIKAVLSCVLFLVAVAAFVWRLLDPGVVDRLAGAGIIYSVLILATGPLALTIGYIGGTLTFPLEKPKNR
jgi:predicted heme/steroid binding protein/uncharacterized membrane protein